MEQRAVRLRHLFAFSLVVLLGLAACAGDPGQSGQRWRAYRDGELPAAPPPSAVSPWADAWPA